MSSSPTKYVVGSIIALFLGYLCFLLAGKTVGCILVGLLLYEGWTLVNIYPEDTISEIIWTYSKRPMIPCMFGYFLGRAIGMNYIPNSDLILITGFLYGHFFFQRQQ